MASLDPQIKSPPFFMHPDHFAMDQIYGLQINDHQSLPPTPTTSTPRHMEQKFVTVLPWI